MTDFERFPDDFLWGAATSAYQIEGSPLADGAGASIWHRFSHTPGRTQGGVEADVACDHYHRWSEDVDLMKALGLGSYRLSLSWSRLLPEGRGRPNPKGIDFYSRLIDRLLDHRIVPMVTLYHWDLPAALDDRGGWLNPDARSWFADYARLAFEALGDRVPWWVTLNEPWVIAHDGYWTGVNAPGHCNAFELPRVSHHLLCAHAAAVQVYRSGWNQRIGIVVNLEPKEAASDSVADRAAAERADIYWNQQYLDPIFFGRYPLGLAAMFGEAWPEHPAQDLAFIRQPVDFVGVNYYTRKVVQHDASAWPDRAAPVEVPNARYTDTHWEVFPEGLTRALCWVKERYGDVPLLVTENGAAVTDPPPGPDGVIDDQVRLEYLRDHVRAVREALRRGVDVRGYYAWSLLDNLEWSNGFSKRFGIVNVDFATQQRRPKASALYYRDLIRSHGEQLARA